jgi:hypothetical protein
VTLILLISRHRMCGRGLARSLRSFASSNSARSMVVYPRLLWLAGNDRCRAISTSCQGIRSFITSSSVKEVSKCLIFLRVTNIRMRFGRKCMHSRVCETTCEVSTRQPNRKLKLCVAVGIVRALEQAWLLSLCM